MTKIVEMLIQNTPEWYEYRRTRYGASDYAAVMSGNRMSTLKNKLYPPKDHSNKFSAWGHHREPAIRELLADKLNIHCDATVIQSENKRIYASLDGFEELTRQLLEIKTCKFTGTKLLDKMQEWAYQMSHQFYCVNDFVFDMKLAVERYKVVNDEFVPKEITVYLAQMSDADKNRLFFVPFVSIDSITKEITEIDNSDPNCIIYCNIQTREEWLKHGEEFLHELDNQFYQANKENINLDYLIEEYAIKQQKLKEYTIAQTEVLEELKSQIESEMQENGISVCKTDTGHSASISYRKKPITEKFIKEKLPDLDFKNPEYIKTVLDIDKIVKIYDVVADKTKLITIK